jgi:diguanylate cyclase (GGDEF)-like protein
MVQFVTIRSAVAAVETVTERRSRLVLPAARPFRRAAGLFLVAILIVAFTLLGHPAILDPAILIPVAALGGVAAGGMASGILGALVGAAYLLLYYTQTGVETSGGLGRVIASIVASAIAMWLAAYLMNRGRIARTAASSAARRSTFVSEFAAQLADESPDDVPTALVRVSAGLLRADMAVLTLLDQQSGRHFVRAAFGGGSAVGVEVTPGVGVTGRAIRDRRIVTGSIDATSASGLNRRLRGNAGAQSMAAVASVQSNRVVASLTVGRADGSPFNVQDQRLLEAIGSVVTLAVAGSLVRGDSEQSTARDPMTGLYTRDYLKAGLDQLLALRRRTAADLRVPLTVLMVEVDHLELINDRHGRDAGDAALRAVAAVLRQRFRQSDVIARTAANEFVVVLAGATMEIAAEVAAQICRQVEELELADGRGRVMDVTVVTGLAVYRDGASVDQLLEAARTSLSRSQGR